MSTPQEATEETPVELPTAVMLQDIRNGAMLVELGEELRTLSRAVTGTGKKGHVILKLTFEPDGDDAILVSDDITTKVPRAAKNRTHRYVDDAGNLTDEHPNRLPLGAVRDVPPQTREVREVSS